MDELPAYTPQALTDLLPIYRPSDAADDHIHTYTLLQTSASSQTLTSVDDSPNFLPLHIKSFKTGGFMNKKPHIIISHPGSDKTPTTIAEAKFDVHGTGTSIIYPRSDTPATQRLELEDSRLQILQTTVNGVRHWWQPFPGNKHVLELTNEYEDVIARFVHTPISHSNPPSPNPEGPERSNSIAQRSNSVWSIQSNSGSTSTKSNSKFKERTVGELHVVDAMVGGNEERTEILCSAIVVVERTRRRRAILENKAGAYGVVRSIGNGGQYIPQ